MKGNYLTSIVEEISARALSAQLLFSKCIVLRLYLGEDAKCTDTIRALKFNNISLLSSRIIKKRGKESILQHFQHQTHVLKKGYTILIINIKQPNSFSDQCWSLWASSHKSIQTLPNTFVHQMHPSYLAQNIHSSTPLKTSLTKNIKWHLQQKIFSSFTISTWSPTLTVIYGAFWVENEMENGIGTLTWTWTELGISDESSPSPSLSPSLNYVLVKFP